MSVKTKDRFRSSRCWGARIRTSECLDQNQVPYRLATPQQVSGIAILFKNDRRCQIWQAAGFTVLQDCNTNN